MRSNRRLEVGIFGLALLLAVGARAYAKNARTFHLFHDSVLNGQELKKESTKSDGKAIAPM